MGNPIDEVLARIWAGVSGDPAPLAAVQLTGTDPQLPSTFAVATAATAAVAATTLSAARLWRERAGTAEDPMVRVDAREAAIAFRSERYLRVDGAPLPALDRLTGDYLARDGWVRLHCNYPNHRDAALRALGLSDDTISAPTIPMRCRPRSADAMPSRSRRRSTPPAARRRPSGHPRSGTPIHRASPSRRFP